MTPSSPRHFPLLCLAGRLKRSGLPIPGTHPRELALVPAADKGRIMTWTDTAEWEGTEGQQLRTLVTVTVGGLYDRLVAYASIATLALYFLLWALISPAGVLPSLWIPLIVVLPYAIILFGSRAEHSRWQRHYLTVSGPADEDHGA